MIQNQSYLVNNPEMSPLHGLKLYTESVNEYICPICRGGKFTSKVLLKKHLTYHKANYPVNCVMCGIFLPHEEGNIADHFLSHFPDDKYECSVCDSSFTDEELIWKHLKNVHDISVETFIHDNNIYHGSELLNDSKIDASLLNRINKPCSSNEGAQNLQPCEPYGRNCADGNVFQNRSFSNEYGKHNKDDESKLALWHHQNFFSMTDNDGHKCPLCKDVFIYCELMPHILQHEFNYSISCPSCPLTFCDKMEFVSHFISHLKRRPFKCLKCNRTFRTQHNVIDHLINAHLIYYKCPICKLDFTNLIEAKKHFRLSHNSELNSNFLGSQMSILENPDMDSFDSGVFDEEGQKHKLVIADHCKYFSFNDSYTHHCPICDVKCTFSTLQAHITDHNFGEPLICIKCKKVFSDHRKLIRHLLSYIKYYPFSCLRCKKNFKRYDLILKHLIEKHDINYKCSLCNKEWRTLMSANKHALSHYTHVSESDAQKSLEIGIGLQTDASILKASEGVNTVSNIQNMVEILQPDTDICSISIKEKHLNHQELDIVPDIDNAEVVFLEEILLEDPSNAGGKDVSRKSVTSLGSSPHSTDQNANPVKPVVIPHRWILNGNDEQYNLALWYEKSVIHDWMSMKDVDIS